MPDQKALESLHRFAAEVTPAFEESERPRLTRLPDFDAGAKASLLATAGGD